MVYRFLLKLSLAVALLGLLLSLLGIFARGQFGEFVNVGGHFLYTTSFGATELFGFLSWFL